MIGALLPSITFMNPFILLGLLALPVIYILLRVTPPAPKIINLPTARFLEGLNPDAQTSDTTPWWILLLRLTIAGLVILAFARPVTTPASTLPGDGAINILINNDWGSAHIWPAQINTATELINQAERENREIFLRSSIGEGVDAGPYTAAQALSTLKGLKPEPWGSDLKTITPIDRAAHTFWLSSGIGQDGMMALAKTYADQGGLTIITPKPENLPLTLKRSEALSQTLDIVIDGLAALPDNMPLSVQVFGQNGDIIDQRQVSLSSEELPLTVKLDLPPALQNKAKRVQIAGRANAGSTLILDESSKRRSVAIIGPSDNERMKPFIEARYYLNRALEPYSTLKTGSVDDVLQGTPPSMIILADIADIPFESLEALESWVEDGGLLLRFAGPNMAAEQGLLSQVELTPFPLKFRTRATEGTLSWDNAPLLETFPKTSPLYGIGIHGDIKIRQQILPSSPDIPLENIWATLDDGTPLVTASAQGKGLLVMVHTSASPDWSELALSGTYVEILKRLLDLSGSTQIAQTHDNATLQPIWILDGFGRVTSPDASIQPIANDMPFSPGKDTPPGLYGSHGITTAFNLGDHISALRPLPDLPSGTTVQTHNESKTHDFMPLLLFGAFILLMVDWLVMMVMSTGLKPLARVSAVLVLTLTIPQIASADESARYANELYLAYIKTGNDTIDATSQRGLENLGRALKRRTSAEAAGVAALDPTHDTLTFFPFIYWPVAGTPRPLEPAALRNVQAYLDHGGTILFDTRGRENANLRTITQGLNIPSLQPIEKNHVLSRSFYLLDEFPGRYTGQTFWVESSSLSGRDGVSSVLIGGHDWVGAWASYGSRANANSRQQDLAMRFGVNLMMYALTGNYKADQVHIPYILERLGQ